MAEGERLTRHRNEGLRPRAGIALGLLWLLVAALPAGRVRAGEPHRAGLVVQPEGGPAATYCLEFEEEEISGADLLTLSGLEVIVDASRGMGITVCQIEGLGCDYPAQPCFCQCMTGSGCAYWNYFYREPGGDWAYSTLGALMRRIGPGSVEAWVWGDGSTPPALDLTFEAICPQPAAPTTPVPADQEDNRAGEAASPVAASATPLPPASATPTLKPGLALPERDAAGTAAAQDPGPSPSPTAPRLAPTAAERATPTAAPVGGASQTDLTSYWPFALLLVGLAFAGALVRLRRP